MRMVGDWKGCWGQFGQLCWGIFFVDTLEEEEGFYFVLTSTLFFEYYFVPSELT